MLNPTSFPTFVEINNKKSGNLRQQNMANRTTPQDYPRINDPNNRFHGFLDESKLINKV